MNNQPSRVEWFILGLLTGTTLAGFGGVVGIAKSISRPAEPAYVFQVGPGWVEEPAAPAGVGVDVVTDPSVTIWPPGVAVAPIRGLQDGGFEPVDAWPHVKLLPDGGWPFTQTLEGNGGWIAR